MNRRLFLGLLAFGIVGMLRSQDLPAIRDAGVLRHLSVPYANFDTGMGDGLDVDMMRLFAEHLGVRYQYVRTDFSRVVGDLTGKRVRPKDGSEIEVIGDTAITGDVAAHGFTILAWRSKIVDFAKPTFPNQVWLVTTANARFTPIAPTKSLADDIAATRKLIPGRTVMGKAGTCLDLTLYDIQGGGATGVAFEGSLNDLAPALLEGESELLLLDVPDALVALTKWPGRIKVLGVMSGMQDMAPAFRKDSPGLRRAFGEFFQQISHNGVYLALIRTYYADVLEHYPEFFAEYR